MLRRLVLYFRYGETGDGVIKRDRVWLGVRRIASIIGVDYRLVQGVLEGKPSKVLLKGVAEKARNKLTTEHIDYLGSQ